jgi:hypothetical protein
MFSSLELSVRFGLIGNRIGHWSLISKEENFLPDFQLPMANAEQLLEMYKQLSVR